MRTGNTVTLPAEPRTGCIVIDRYGVAAQRIDTHWQVAGVDTEPMPWPWLLYERGPVRLVHMPDDVEHAW